MRCPICEKPVTLQDPFMPFCSDRCKLIDLGNWASERYVIPTPIHPSEILEAEAEAQPEDGGE